MQMFKNKFLVKLIAMICLFLTLLNFAGASKVYAEDEVWGGVLIKPIVNLLTGIGDAIMDILHDALLEQKVTMMKINGDTNWWAFWKTVAIAVLSILAAVVFVVAVAATSGLASAALGVLAGGTFSFSMGSVSAGLVLGGVAVGVCVGIRAGNAWFPDDIYLPVFTVSAEEIFKNDLALFDVNFFEPGRFTTQGTEKRTISWERKEIFSDSIDVDDTENPAWKRFYEVRGAVAHAHINNTKSNEEFQSLEELKSYDWSSYASGGSYAWLDMYDVRTNDALVYVVDEINKKQREDELPIIAELVMMNADWDNNRRPYTKPIVHVGMHDYSIMAKEYWRNNEYGSPIACESHIKIQDSHGNILYTIEYSFENSGSTYIPATIKVFREAGSEEVLYEGEIEVISTAQHLAGAVSKWYFILRNAALLILMLLLIYSGIRIVIGSTAGEKAKYKERLMDWIVAVCLIFIMHYIMVFAVKFVGRITDLVESLNDKNINGVFIPLTNNQWNNAKDMDWSDFGADGTFEQVGKNVVDGPFCKVDTSVAESGVALSWQTNLIGLFRIQSQFENEGSAKWVGYSFCYIVLVLFTIFFAFTYVKRILYMAFLTMMAPLVAMTYPFDKITDGKAQAFDAWLKEYIFNLMIQPLHLLLYTVLVTSAFELVSKNAIYALVAVGFMMPAEKLMRRFFGFEKAKTPGLLGGAAGAALAMSGLQNLMKHKSHGGKPDGENSKEQNKVKFANKNNIDTMGAVAGGAAPTLTAGGGSSSGDSSGDGEGTNPIRQQPSPHSEGGNNTNPPIGNGMLDDDDIEDLMSNTTLGSEDWDHGGFSTSGEEGEESDSVQPIDTFAQTRAARAAYDNITVTPPALSDEERRKMRANRRRAIGRATGAVLLGTGKQMAAGVLRGIHPMKLAGKIAAGATAGTAGLLLGIAAGDPSKAFQYTTAGAVAGSTFAGSFSGSKMIDSQKIKEDAEIAYYGADYKQKVIEDQRKAFQKDASNINYLRQTMGVGKEEAKEILSTTGGQCFDNGITSIEDIATIHKLTNGEDRLSFNQAVAARNYAKKRLPSDPDQMTEDTKAEYIKRWKHEYQRAGYANAGDLANKSFDLAIRFNKAQSSLTKNP